MIRSLSILSLLLLASCGQGESAEIQLSNAWARPTAGQAPAAIYLTVENKGSGSDRLTGAFTERAALAMVHQNYVVDEISKMRVADDISIPPNKTVEFRPGGTHIMLEGLRSPLKPGDSFDLVVRFRNSKDQTVRVAVLGPEGR